MKKNFFTAIIIGISLLFITNAHASCTYNLTYGNSTITYELELQYVNGNVKMSKCTASVPGMATNDCSSYTLNTNGYSSTSCPSSIEVDGRNNVLSLINNGKGDYKGNDSNNGIAPSSCIDYNDTEVGKYKGTCVNNQYFACVWNETKFGNYCNVDNAIYVSCGDAYDIPYQVPEIISFVVNLLKIATPIILIIVSIISLLKALAASKDDEIKKAQNILVKRLIAAALVFFVISITQFVILKVAESKDEKNISSCLSCFLNNDCGNTSYYKTNVGGVHSGVDNKNGKYLCTYFNGTQKTCK